MAKKKGSALLMILIALVVLSLIGTAIISYATSNYKLRNKVSDNYEDRYIAEGGIDQAYGAIILLLNNADDKASVTSNLNKIAGDSISDYENGYYVDLKSGDLIIEFIENTPSFNGDSMQIQLVSEYNKQKVEGVYSITFSSKTDYTINLDSKTFQ